MMAEEDSGYFQNDGGPALLDDGSYFGEEEEGLDDQTLGGERLALEGDLEEDDLEEETFGTNVSEISKDFDYTAGNELLKEEDETNQYGVFTASNYNSPSQRLRTGTSPADSASAVKILSQTGSSTKSKGIWGTGSPSTTGFMVSDSIWSSGGILETQKKAISGGGSGSGVSILQQQQQQQQNPNQNLHLSQPQPQPQQAPFLLPHQIPSRQTGQPSSARQPNENVSKFMQQAMMQQAGPPQATPGRLPPMMLSPNLMAAPPPTSTAKPMTVAELEAMLRNSSLPSQPQQQSSSSIDNQGMNMQYSVPPPQQMNQPYPPGVLPLPQQGGSLPLPMPMSMPNQMRHPGIHGNNGNMQVPLPFPPGHPQSPQRYPSYPPQPHQYPPHQQRNLPMPYRGGGGGRNYNNYPPHQQYPHHPQYQRYPPPPPPSGNLTEEQKMQLEIQYKQARERNRKRRYDGLMTAHEKFLIVRIHSSQLQMDDPIKDDYYYHFYMLRRSVDAAQQKNRYLVVPPSSFRRPHHTDNTPVTKEGALGVIPRHSINRPRQLLQVLKSSEDAPSQTKKTTPLTELSKTSEAAPTEVLTRSLLIKCLRQIEDTYQAIIDFEDSSIQLQLRKEEESPNEEEMEELSQKRANALDRLPSLMFVDTPGANIDANSFVHLFRFSKAKRSLRRALLLLPPENAATFIRVFFSVIDRLDLADPNLPWNEDLQEFYANVIPTFKEVIQGFSGNLLLEVIKGIKSLPLFNIFNILRTKIGVTLFTSVFAKATEVMNDDDFLTNEWTQEFNAVFGILEGNYLHLLTATTDSLLEIWIYLTNLVQHANLEQRFSLLSEIRDNVMDLLRNKPEEDLIRLQVISFLGVLGIDSTQIQALIADS